MGAQACDDLGDALRLSSRCPLALCPLAPAIQINAGAGFLVVLTGDIVRMPGLSRQPLAESIDLRDGVIVDLR